MQSSVEHAGSNSASDFADLCFKAWRRLGCIDAGTSSLEPVASVLQCRSSVFYSWVEMTASLHPLERIKRGKHRPGIQMIILGVCIRVNV